jgi:hypothetical protein
VLDRLRSRSYIGASVVAAGVVAACHIRPGPLLPAPLPPLSRDSALTWARETLPRHPTAIRFRWKYRDDRLSAAGRGQVRIAPPDSLRLDYAATLGVKTGAGVVVGDSMRWADPEADVRTLVPAIPMLWAALGFVQAAPDSAAVSGGRLGAEGGAGDGGWDLRVVTGADTLEYRFREGHDRTLDAQWRRAGRLVAASQTRFGARTGDALGAAWPATARIDFPEGAARFDLTVVVVDTAAVIAPALWRSRR